jgi:hypothetical protein
VFQQPEEVCEATYCVGEDSMHQAVDVMKQRRSADGMNYASTARLGIYPFIVRSTHPATVISSYSI